MAMKTTVTMEMNCKSDVDGGGKVMMDRIRTQVETSGRSRRGTKIRQLHVRDQRVGDEILFVPCALCIKSVGGSPRGGSREPAGDLSAHS